MNGACACGMSIESGSHGCQECGTACCRSCAIEVAANTYCRWCAMSLARASVS